MARAASTEVATKDEQETGLTITNDQLAALQAQQEQEIDSDLITTPILKIGQPLTREVQDEQAEAGEFINTLTGEGIGDDIEFVVAAFQRGRFAADRRTGRAYVSFDKTIPASWSDLVGEEWVGTPFDEYPQAEEVYKRRANAKEIEWGSGPLVSTTYNFTGLAIVPAPEGSDEDDEVQPVRLSLQRTTVRAARKMLTARAGDRRLRQAFWGGAFRLTTRKERFAQGNAYVLEPPRVVRETTSEERQAAVELAQLVFSGRVQDNQAGDSAKDAPVEPKAEGGLAV